MIVSQTCPKPENAEVKDLIQELINSRAFVCKDLDEVGSPKGFCIVLKEQINLSGIEQNTIRRTKKA